MSSGLFIAEAEPESRVKSIITVRLPKGMHKALKLEAHTKKVSLNDLCISKLRPEPVPVETTL